MATGAVLVGVLAFQLWRAWRLESQLQAAEIGRAMLLGERILQRASTSDGLWAALPAEHRFSVRGDHVVVDEAVGWLEPLSAEADDDAVVLDRLQRASRAEFVDRDLAAAAREYDELLAGPLRRSQRLQVLAAAAWQARRAGADERQVQLQADLLALARELTAVDLASPTTAGAIAALVRLAGQPALPREVELLLPWLPAVPFAALAVDATLRERHGEIVRRRARMQRADRLLAELGARAEGGMHAAEQGMLWWLPATSADGTQRAALIEPAAWFDAVRRLGRQGELPEWPRWVEPEFGAVHRAAFAGVPGLRGLGNSELGTLGSRAWLLPVFTALLLSGFALAVWQQLRAARREADAVAVQAQFLTTVTHELKTPLAGIRLLGEMLAEGRAHGREPEYYRLLVGEAGRLSMLIENVLDLGRLERGERRYELRPVAIGEVVRETLAMFAPLAEQDGFTVAFADRTEGRMVQIDRGAFVQALVAVLDNARKYGAECVGTVPGQDPTHSPTHPPARAASETDERTGDDQTGRMRIDLSADSAVDAVSVTVRDHGPGVPAGEHERVFERFVRGAAHQHGSTPGVGIGLYLARSIVRRFGGDLTCIAPEAGAGAAFHFLLPSEKA